MFVNGTLELALNHVITYNNLIKSLGLNDQVLPLNTLLLVKKEAYAELQNKKEKRKEKTPTTDGKMLKAEILVTKDEINAIQKKRFSLFKQLLHETI